MPEPWDSLSLEAQAELKGYAEFAGNNFSEFGNAATGMASDAFAGAGNAYQHFMTGKPMPYPVTGGTMETTTSTSEPLTGPPESYSAALLKHGVAEGLEKEADHFRQYANRDTTAPDIEPAVNGWERYSATFHGVGPASSPGTTPQPEQEQGHEPEL